MKRYNLDKDYVRVFLEKEQKPFNESVLVAKLHLVTEKHPRTIKGWLKFYRERYHAGRSEGVIHQKYGREAFYYAEEHRDKIEKDYWEILPDAKIPLDEIQQNATNQKCDLGDAFPFWLKDHIKDHVYDLEVLQGRLHYFPGISKLIDVDLIKKRYEKRQTHKGTSCSGFLQNAIESLDSLLFHPDEDIRKAAWEYYVYWKEKREDAARNIG